jgi:hypothetical protein
MKNVEPWSRDDMIGGAAMSVVLAFIGGFLLGWLVGVW